MGPVRLLPTEAHSPLVVDPDRVLAFSLSFESLELVAGNRSQGHQAMGPRPALEAGALLQLGMLRTPRPDGLARSAPSPWSGTNGSLRYSEDSSVMCYVKRNGSPGLGSKTPPENAPLPPIVRPSGSRFAPCMLLVSRPPPAERHFPPARCRAEFGRAPLEVGCDARPIGSRAIEDERQYRGRRGVAVGRGERSRR